MPRNPGSLERCQTPDHMTETGGLPQPGATITREVRWFFEGPLPVEVKMWFTDHAKRGTRESRTDVYDMRAARDGVGIKRRDGATVDAKHRLGESQVAELLPGVGGLVEDWGKTRESGLVVGRDQVVVAKEIVTLVFECPGDWGYPTGCEAELASIRVGPRRWWSLCFETYGNPAARAEAFQLGIDSLLGTGPLPAPLSLSALASSGYPDWIARLGSTG